MVIIRPPPRIQCACGKCGDMPTVHGRERYMWFRTRVPIAVMFGETRSGCNNASALLRLAVRVLLPRLLSIVLHAYASIDCTSQGADDIANEISLCRFVIQMKPGRCLPSSECLFFCSEPVGVA